MIYIRFYNIKHNLCWSNDFTKSFNSVLVVFELPNATCEFLFQIVIINFFAFNLCISWMVYCAFKVLKLMYGSPLIPSMSPTQCDPILTSTLKSLLKFTKEDSKTLVEHFQDVVDVCTMHNVT